MNFAIQSGYSDRGVTAICSTRPYRICKDGKILPEETPLGSVEWIEKIIGHRVVPDYFPAFLSHLLYRKTWVTDSWPLGKRCFIKPAYKHKAWKANVYSGRGYAGKRKGPYICSEVARFRNEFRYYVANGKVLSGWWYWGDSLDDQQRHDGSEPPDAPALPEIDWPSDYCGAVDFGVLWETGELALIEANAPFSCGWYGVDSEHYAQFLESGWQFVKSKVLSSNIL